MTPRELLKAIAEKDGNLQLFENEERTQLVMRESSLWIVVATSDSLRDMGLMSYCLEEMQEEYPTVGRIDQWVAWVISQECKGRGATPHEAVYRLYLAYLEKK